MSKKPHSVGSRATGPEALDATDFRIVGLLLRNGRMSFASIGAEVGLSAHGAADRVRRLERMRIIRGYTAVVDLEGVGWAIDAVVDVRLLPQTVPEAFERTVVALAAVREVAFVTGRFDYQVRVACRDSDHLDATVRAIRANGVIQTETRIVLRALTSETSLG